MNTSFEAQAELPPSITATNGEVQDVAYERVPSSIRHIIHALFPAHTRGRAIISGLLANATVKSYTLPNTPEKVRADTAIVSVTNGYVELSELLGLSYDTTHMYMAIYRALGLLIIEKQGKQTTICIPLDAYQPPPDLTERLQQLQERYLQKRPRMRRMVDHVIERIGCLIQEGQERSPYYAELLKYVQYVFSIRGVADPDGQIAESIATKIAPLITAPVMRTVSPDEMQEGQVYLPRPSQEKIPAQLTLPQESMLPGEPTENERQQHEQNLPEIFSLQVISQLAKSDRYPDANRPALDSLEEDESATTFIAEVSTKCGRFFASKLPPCQQIGKDIEKRPVGNIRFEQENLPIDQHTRAPCQASSVRTVRNLPGQVDSAKILPPNGIGIGGKTNNNIIKSKPVPVPVPSVPPVPLPCAHPLLRQQARALAMLVEGKEDNLGAYITLLKEHDSQTLKAGVIATLLRKHIPEGKGVLRKPGGYFTRRVQQYRHAVPEQILALVEAFGEASYEEIDAALRAQAKPQSQRQFAGSASSQDVSLPWKGEPMDREAAEALSRRIAHEDTYVQVMGLCMVGGNTYAVKVFIGHMEYYFRSVEDWNDYHAEMQMLDQEVIP